MIKTKYIILLFAFFAQNLLVAQAQTVIKSEGKIPKEFITPSSEKYKKKIVDIEKEGSKGRKAKQAKENKKQFYLESSFSIDDVLQSGVIVFNDPICKYVEKVLSQLPISSKLKKTNPRVYLLNSSEVNAFATEQGIIFVSVGLLANVENEAQLAFILGHELAHVESKHSIDKFLKSKELDSKDFENNVKKIGIDSKLFSEALYSRQLEEEADEDGLKTFLKSKYDPTAISGIFEVLHYSYLPYDDIDFEKSFFEDEYYKLPKALWKDTVNHILPMTESKRDEEESTHPSSEKRLENLQNTIPESAEEDQKIYLVGKDDFLTVQTRARYQLPFLALENWNYNRALYNAYLQLLIYPDDLMLKKVIGKSLYYLAKSRNFEDLTSGGRKRRYKYVDKMEGASQRVDHLIGKMNDEELNILALKYNYELLSSNKTDQELSNMVDDLFAELLIHHDDLSKFSNKAPEKKTAADRDSSSVDLKKEEVKEETASSRRKSKIRTIKKKNYYWKYAFVDYVSSADFKKRFEKALNDFEEQEKKNEYYDTREGAQELRKRNIRDQKKGKSLGIEKVVAVNPFYLSIDERKDNAIQYIRSENNQALLRTQMQEIAKNNSPLDVEMMDVTALSVNDVDKFNDLAEIEKYVGQQFSFYDWSLTPGINQERINAIAEKYDTDYFLWTAVISLREKENFGKLAYCIIMPWALPFIVPDMVTPDYDMLYYAILFDVKTGRRSVIKMDYFNAKDSKALIKSHIYDVFHQISKGAN